MDSIVIPPAPVRSLQIKYLTGVILAVALIVLIGLPGFYSIFYQFGLPKTGIVVFMASRILFWVCSALLFCYALKAEKQKPLLWPGQKYRFIQTLKFMLCIFAAIFAGSVIINIILHLTGLLSKSVRLEKLIAIFRANKFPALFTVFTAAVTEEFIFRGYIQPRLEVIFNSSWAAIIVSSLLFGFAHLSFGTVQNVTGPLLIGLVFAYFYSRYRNIKILMLCHFLWDLMAVGILLQQHPH